MDSLRPAVFVDSSVLLYAVGAQHPLRGPSRSLIQGAFDGLLDLHASFEAIQEVAFHRMRRAGRADAVTVARDFLELLTCYPVDSAVIERSLGLMLTTRLRGRDAVHAATAIQHGFDQIVTADTDFAAVDGLAPVDPAGLAFGE